MKFKVGDKVKFLNEKGGGIVSKIFNNNMVSVAIDDGFELPVLASELVLVDSKNAGERFFEEHYAVENRYGKSKDSPLPEGAESNADSQPFSNLPLGIYIAFVPVDQQVLVIGNMELILINNTSYDVIYSLFIRDIRSFRGVDFGNADKFSYVSIQVLDRGQLELFTNVAFQFLYYKDEIPELLTPCTKETKIKLLKLLKEDNFIKNSVFKKKALFYKITESPETIFKDKDSLAEVIKLPEKLLIKDKYIANHIVGEGFAEVDLHIEVLCESPEKLRKHEKLQIQIDYFNRCLESAISESLERVVFIHGVGAGILKLEISNVLQQYEFIEYFDASIARYGVGATEIIIHHTKNV